MEHAKIIEGNCLDLLPGIPDSSIDAIITDPPYPEIKRSYGRLTETEWHALMDEVVHQAKRVLKPTGSAVFILQSNSKHVGEMRLWLWEWLVRTAKSWNLVQDVYWWNHAAAPTVHAQRTVGLMRPSVKMCCWFGQPDCFRNQDAVLWTVCDWKKKGKRLEDRALHYSPSGQSTRTGRMLATAEERGGSTPFNLLPISNTASNKKHPAMTPYLLCEWWVRYLTRPGETVLDPFSGSGTVGVAALDLGRHYVGFEQNLEHCQLSERAALSLS